MESTQLLVGMLVSFWALIACAPIGGTQPAQVRPSPQAHPTLQEVRTMNGAIAPSGVAHPGEIRFEDQVDQRQWTKQAAEVPQSIAWVEVNGVWQPVTRIEITGTAEQRRITKFGQDGGFLETTIQSPPPPQSQPEPPPSPTPTPQSSQ